MVLLMEVLGVDEKNAVQPTMSAGGGVMTDRRGAERAAFRCPTDDVDMIKL